MNQLQMLKIALIGYVNSMKAVWSDKLYPLSIISKRNGKLKDYHIYGNTAQDGEPAPENPIPMQSVGELVTNLFDKNNVNYRDAYIRVDSNQYLQEANSRSVLIECQPNTTYTISHNVDNLGVFRACYINEEPPQTGYFAVDAYSTAQANAEEKILNITTGNECKFIVVQGSKSVFDEFLENLTVIKGEYTTPETVVGKYHIPINVRGKNLLKAPLDINSWEKNLITSANYSYNLGKILPLNETVTLSFDYTTIPQYFYFLTDDESVATLPYLDTSLNIKYLVIEKVQNLKLTFTPKEGKSYYLHNALAANNTSKDVAQAWLDRFTYIQIEYGSEATEYEEYKEPQTLDIYLNEPLRKIGDNEDYIDFGKGAIVRNIGVKEFTGDEEWQTHNTKNLIHLITQTPPEGYSSSTVYVKSSHLKSYAWAELYGNTNKADGSLIVGVACTYNTTYGLVYVYACPYSNSITVDEWKALLQQWNEEGNPFTVIYAMGTTEEKIELPKLPQFKGTTVYEVDTTVKASGMEVCYYE